MAKLQRYHLLLILIIFLCNYNLAQPVHLKIISHDKDTVDIQKVIPYKNTFPSQAACVQYLNQLKNELLYKGYISASIDSIKTDSVLILAYLFLGEQYRWKQARFITSDKNVLLNEDRQNKNLTQQIVNPNQMEVFYSSILNVYSNKGYPFATIQADSIELKRKELSASIKVDKGILYKLDSIRVFGNVNIKKMFLYRYLNLMPNSVYSIQKLNKINSLLQQIPYLQSFKNWDLQMLSNSYLIDLYLQSKRSNRIDIIAGLLPSNQQTNNSLLFTIDAQLLLQNALGTGESLTFSWQQIQPQSPRINIGMKKPYFLNTTTNIDLGLNLYKRDSSYINIDATIGAEILFAGLNKGRAFLQSFKTNLITVDTATIIATKRLPDILDINITSIGIETELNDLDYISNPRKGTQLSMNATAGLKNIRRNSVITQLKSGGYNYNGLYDIIPTNTYQTKIKLAVTKYFKLGRQSTIKSSCNAGIIQSPVYIKNELFQIGGIKLLRGFDEENTFVSSYLINTIEYRYLMTQNSFLSTFVDIGFSGNVITKQSYNYIGTGIGLAFETKQGILNFNLAIGKRNDLPFNLRQSKIHIGYVTKF